MQVLFLLLPLSFLVSCACAAVFLCEQRREVLFVSLLSFFVCFLIRNIVVVVLLLVVICGGGTTGYDEKLLRTRA